MSCRRFHEGGVRGHSVPVTVERLTMSYGAVQAVGGISFHVTPGHTVTLLGPSGCGKTTTLRCIAGLEVPTAGRIMVGERVVFDDASNIFVEPERRNIGMVFQSYWPHMTVGGNVGFPLTIAGLSKNEVQERTHAVLELVGLGDLQRRSAADLSGGQQQRVALARALVHEPRVVVFDEPLSNLDANLRERMRAELLLLQSRLGFTAIFVTHDQKEALSLSDYIVIMNKGLIEQTGSPQEIFTNPATAFAARFLGYSNVFPGWVAAVGDAGVVQIDFGEGMHLSALWRSPVPPRNGEDSTVAFRADRVVVRPGNQQSGENVFAGEVETAAFLGTTFDYTIKSGKLEIQAEGSVDHPVSRGQAVNVYIPAEHCHAFSATTAS
jgi:iron(III) transport system ATP-binding protein